jgi:putative hydrolase of the HAD superfamily
MSRIKTVLWDTGGVLLTNGWDHNQRKTVFDALGVDDREGFDQRHDQYNDLWEKGTIDFDEYLERTIFYKPRPFSAPQIKKAIIAESVVLPDTAMPILEELHTRDEVRMGQLNNESRELNEVRLERFALKQFLSVFFCSGYVGLRKPDTAIYRLALEVLQAAPAEVAFIDDREKNAAAAASLGMHGIVYTGSAALRAELETLGLL